MGLAAIMRSKTLQQSVLSDLLLWIDNNLDKKLTVDDLSDISGYSPWHLFRLFRHYFDRSPMEYIRQQRMSLCRRLLLTTPGYRIVDICMMVGYDDLSAFNRTFKKYHALTPTQYR
ncbi:helix-turn-helix transcriptional regulator, partial [Klebsiella pneumoniae]|nr:helix-turn-helix transcriptional regulator [Klebsiella pneumoniae]